MYICVMCVRSGLYGSGAMSGPERGARRKLRVPQKIKIAPPPPRRVATTLARPRLRTITLHARLSPPYAPPSLSPLPTLVHLIVAYQKLVCGRLYPLCRSAMCWLKFSPTWPSEL